MDPNYRAITGPAKKLLYSRKFLLLVLDTVVSATLFFIGKHYPTAFTTSHEVVWPIILIAMTVLIWIAWVRQATDVPEPQAQPTP